MLSYKQTDFLTKKIELLYVLICYCYRILANRNCFRSNLGKYLFFKKTGGKKWLICTVLANVITP